MEETREGKLLVPDIVVVIAGHRTVCVPQGHENSLHVILKNSGKNYVWKDTSNKGLGKAYRKWANLNYVYVYSEECGF